MKIKKVLLLLSLLCLLALVLGCAVACGETPDPDPTPDQPPEPPAPEKVTYSVTLVDGDNNQMTDIIVKVMKGEEQIKMLAYNGAAVTFEADADTYTLVLDVSQVEGSYTYDEALCTLTAEKPSATVHLYLQASQTETVNVGAPINKAYEAQHIGVGSYRLALTANDYTFLIFRPEVAAIYTITYECEGELAVSYHGSTFFVQGNDLSEGAGDLAKYENGLSLKVYPANLGGDFVFAVKSSAATSCVLHVKNAGDPGTRLEDLPWTPFLEDNAKVQQHLAMSPAGTYTTVDVTDASLTAVFNATDGFYHMGSADGPILFIDLTSDTTYIASIQTICANQRMGIYVYDDNGNVIEKRSYNELFHQYGMPTDTTAPEGGPIRIPLTAKLAEAILEFGEKNDWWTAGSEKNIFTAALAGMPYNQAAAWLLYCGYYA